MFRHKPQRRRTQTGQRLLLILLVLAALGTVLEHTQLLPVSIRSLVRDVENAVPGDGGSSSPAAPAPAPTASPQHHPDAAIDYAQVQGWLEAIPVRPEVRRGYRREDWPHWLDADRNCLDTREEVLIRDSLEAVHLSADGCSVISGLWRDPYTGDVFREPRRLDIDHVVALQEAHDSGAHAWDRPQRMAFANDLDDPRTLRAASAAANRAKSAYGPEAWLPPDSSYRCRYVADWVAIKARWHLAMDESERVVVGNILADCRTRR